MNLTLRAVVATTFLATLASVCLTADPAFAADTGLDIWDLPEIWKANDAANRDRDKLERIAQATSNRLAVRAETVEAVLAGRTEPEAAVRTFVELNRSDAKALELCRANFAGATDEERAARQLVSHVRSQGPDTGATADRIARRLGVAVAGP
jgi:hypothetical protein